MLPIHHQNVAGIDAGSTQFFVAVPGGPVRSFESHTGALYALREYLREQGGSTVAMEATGVYWLALYEVLECAGIEVCMVNGAHVKNLPGRKSDVQDCQWLAQLHAHGLLRKSFVPPEGIRALRSYTRLREDHIRTGAMYVQHMQKALDQLNIKLHTVISQITGTSGLAVVRAILQGQRDPTALAQLCDARILKTKRKAVEASLRGLWKDEHLFALRQGLEGWEFCQQQVEHCDQAIATQLQHLTENLPPPPTPQDPPARQKSGRHHVPQVPGLHESLLQLSAGADAVSLPGISPSNWLRLTSEVGTDLSRWPNEKAFVSWLGLAPGKNQSGKRNKRSPRRAKTPAGQIFRLAAQSIARSTKLALGGYYRRLKARTSATVANLATARKLAQLYYRAMRHGLSYVEAGLESYEQMQKQRQERYLQKRAAELGFTLTPLHAGPVH